MRKLAIICLIGLDNFLQWVSHVTGYETRIFLVNTPEDIQVAIDWGDIIWFEWCNESAIAGLNYIAEQKKMKMFSARPDNLYACQTPKPVIVRLHAYEALHGYSQQINWSQVGRLILVADHMLEILEMTAPGIRGKVPITVISNGVDVENIPALNPGPGFEIASVGDISHKKNPMLMLQVMAKLVSIDKRYRLHVAGAHQELRYMIYLRHMVNAMGLNENVIFYGHVDDMAAFWPGKNYLLHTSVQEGHCVSIIEAMARGIRPVIHNFYGAEGQYPVNWIWNAVDEAVSQIQSEKYSSRIQEYVTLHNWTITAQAAAITGVLEGIIQ